MPDSNIEKIVLKVKGMHCAACAILIDKLLSQKEGIVSVSTSFGAERIKLEYVSSQISLAQIKSFVSQLGYNLILPEEGGGDEEAEKKAREEEIRNLRNSTIISFLIASPIIVYYMGVHMLNLQHVHEFFDLLKSFGIISQKPWLKIDLNYIYFIMTTPIQFGIGWHFYRNAWTAFRVGSANMDVLVVLGTTAAYLYSALGFFVLGIDHPYWESSAALISFIILGRYLEALARGKASEAIRKLLKLAPTVAHRFRNGQEEDIPLTEVKVNDILIVKPGEKIPVDGAVIEGHTSVDEKVITGESMPIDKKVGDEMIGATINLYGLIKIKAEKVGKETLLYQIVKMVEEAQASKAYIQRLADKVVEYFVPVVIVIAILTFVVWYFFIPLPGGFRAALLLAVSVLVVSCPCAMGLATPMAIIVGTGKGAEYGILIKGGEALERAYKINSFAFDKTGTLTKGEPAVTDIVSLAKFSAEEILLFSAVIEQGSEHPLAQAIVKTAKEKKMTLVQPVDFEQIPGLGVRGKYQNKEIIVGNEMMMEKFKVDISPYQKEAEKLSEEAKTVLYVVENKKIIGLLALADTLKPYSLEAIKKLKETGMEIIMITGDNQKTADAIGQQLGISRNLAKVLPQDKAKMIKQLQSEGKVVAMVGDGINDAPALASADIGIAVGSGTDIAMETGHIVLIKDDLRDVVTAMELSRKTIHKTWQNLFWAFIYNILAIPVSAGLLLALAHFGLIPQTFGFALRPEIAGFAMAFSSVSVVTNSLTLRLFKPKI